MSQHFDPEKLEVSIKEEMLAEVTLQQETVCQEEGLYSCF